MLEALEAKVQSRLQQAKAQIENSLRNIAQRNPLGAEPDRQRLRERLQTKALLSRDEASAMALGIEAARPPGPEAIWGSTIDFLSVSFLERGAQAARAVARVAFRQGNAQGSGFLIAPRLFLTNHHVISSAAFAAQLCVEFDYELDPQDRPRGITRFAFAPQQLILNDGIDGLDYCLIALGEKLIGPKDLPDFGFCPLSGSSHKHALGEVANIVQHPDGRYKEVVLHENRLVARLEAVLHYVADTEPGSSGSPVFNNEWQAIALHHWGGPWRQKVDDAGRPLPRTVNEGIRISSILEDLRQKYSGLDSARKAILRPVLENSETNTFVPAALSSTSAPLPATPTARLDPNGTITWTIPLEVSVRLPHLSPPPPLPPPSPATPPPDARLSGGEAPNQNYSNRGGYKPNFLSGFHIPLPALTDEQQQNAARNKEAEDGDDPFELKYHHFSIVMNAARRLAYFTACNINGRTAKFVNRKTGAVRPATPDDVGSESLSEAAEASDTWYRDHRIEEDQYAGKAIYERQVVPGFPNNNNDRNQRMFQRGHLVRRMDPAWGSDQRALDADADTFHWTNCSPQVGFFNQGKASPDTPNSGQGKLWRAVENYVLRSAIAEDLRVLSFTGPVFADDDRPFRGIQVPGRFWKITVWAEAGELRAVALIADQRPVIEVWPESLESLPESFLDPGELERVQDFLTTVADIEALTQLDFGEDIRNADVMAGEATRRITRPAEIPLRRPAPGTRRRRNANRP